ncbi:MAG: hypothetical protein Q9160_000643 [Pyrenula sp. 1 TL-2023]
MGIFQKLSTSDHPVKDVDIASQIEADPALVSRITRCLASFSMIQEVGSGIYSSNNVSKTFARSEFQEAFNHLLLSIAPSWRAMPEYFKSNGYRSPTNSQQLPFNVEFKTSLSFYGYAAQHESVMRYAGQYMNCWHEGLKTWLDVYPLEAECSGSGPKEVLFVDVGGGFGQQCLTLRKCFPNLTGEVILQDLSGALTSAGEIPAVRSMVHDFFTPQPVRNARYYYLRNILHGHTDEICRTILSHLMTAMGPQSRIIVDEMSMPDAGAHYFATQMDIAMMAALGGKERTDSEWQALFDSVGLKIEKAVTYTPLFGETVMAVVKA